MDKKIISAILLVVFVFSLYSCGNSNMKIPASKRPAVHVKVNRYGVALFRVDTSHFKAAVEKLQKEYPFFLEGDLNNKANIQQLRNFVADPQVIDVYKKTMLHFPDLDNLEKELSTEFSYIQYYFPKYKLPQVYSYVSDLYYEQPVMKKDSVLVIALDDYLGENYKPYLHLNIPFYHRRLMKKEFIPVDVAKALYRTGLSVPQHSTTVLDHMIETGKMLYFLDAVLPETPDTLKIGYTRVQWKWMEKHKKDVWSVMINDNMLFSSDYMVINKMMQPGPFTDGFSRTAPPSMGAWFGWQIVRKFMSDHPNTTLKQLFEMKDAQTILHQSGYKP